MPGKRAAHSTTAWDLAGQADLIFERYRRERLLSPVPGGHRSRTYGARQIVQAHDGNCSWPRTWPGRTFILTLPTVA